jgi:HEAT repeats
MGMPLPAPLGVDARPDLMCAALCAAELNEPFDLVHTPSVMLAELFHAVPRLRQLVPFATFRLLARLGNDPRDEVRVGTARALAEFVEMYPERVEELLLPLACDPSRRVRTAAVEPLAALLARQPEMLAERWRWHPDRAVEVLERARKQLAKQR